MVDARYDWNEEAVAKLKLCIDNKMSARATAVLLGVSKSAAVSAAIRYGTRFQSNDPRNNHRAVPVEEAAPAPTPFTSLPAVLVFEDEEYPLETVADDLEQPQTRDLGAAAAAEGVTIHELRHTHCRAVIAGDCWDVSTIRYCGQPRANERFSFCKDHADLYLTTPAKMRAAAAREAE